MAGWLDETPTGFALFDGNEFSIGSKEDDPSKVRVTAPTTAHGGGGGVYSFSRSREAGVPQTGHQQEEMGFIRVEQSEAVRGDPTNNRAELNIFLNRGGTEDEDMVRAIAIECDRVTQINPDLLSSFQQLLNTGGPSGWPSRMASPNNRYWLQLQDDGNFVIYDALDPAHVKPTFDLWWLMATLQALGHTYPA